MKVESCQCVTNKCAWSMYREDLVIYWISCKRRGSELGDISCVDEVANRRAQKIMYVKYNQLINAVIDAPDPVCFVNGNSWLFTLEAFKESTFLDYFIDHGARPCKRKKVTVEINVMKT